MNYDHHTPQQSATYCQQALTLMASRQIAPNPTNFTVWYSHVCGEWPSLSKALNALMSSGEKFTSACNAAIHTRFFATPYEALPLHSMAERIESELAAVLGSLEQASRSASEYGRFLQDTSGEVATGQGGDGVRHILGRLLHHTRAMSLQSLELERQLQASSSEVAKLKTELDGARREALIDPLTGLGNRKMSDFVLRETAMVSTETGEPLSLLLIDVDYFKKINDEFGHSVGDQVLRLLALALGENIKGQDTAARYGGEEFAIVLPRTAGGDAHKLAENIRERISSIQLVMRKSGEKLGQVTVSIGVAEWALGEPLAEFVERADRALYAAKQTGRNRVIAAEDMCTVAR